jgi:hypothetical protein
MGSGGWGAGGWIMWGIIFVSILGLYLYVRSRRLRGKK